MQYDERLQNNGTSPLAETHQIWINDRRISILDIAFMSACVVHSAVMLQEVADAYEPRAVIKTHDLLKVGS